MLLSELILPPAKQRFLAPNVHIDDGAKDDLVHRIMDYFETKGFTASAGSTRMTYISPKRNIVFKVPKNDKGIRANEFEAGHWHHSKKSEYATPPVARCRIVYLDDDKLIPILAMELVTPIKPDEPYPEWSGWVDGNQFGRNKHGRMVAYDI